MAKVWLQGFDPVLWADPLTLRRALGTTVQAVVLDGHHPLPAEAFGQAQGLIGSGGVLVVRLPETGVWPRDPRLAVPPFSVDDVGQRFTWRVVAALDTATDLTLVKPPPVRERTMGTADQAAVVQFLRSGLDGPPACTVVTARRGRGKSSALGLALRHTVGRVCLTSPDPRAVAEVVRFAERPDVAFIEPSRLRWGDFEPRLVVVDEAAALSVAWLQALVRRFEGAHFWFATTTEGYEGTGRGFGLRFGAWLGRQARPTSTLTLHEPIRYPADDPLERAVTHALLMTPRPPLAPTRGTVHHEVWDREVLASDERALNHIFGLLVHAHYRTTPGDLQRLLDAPNLALHTLRQGDTVVAASIVALEGPLDEATIEALTTGTRRLRGQALPETLVSHAGVREAGALRFIRSVRIVTHPACRRRGLARQLVAAIHEHYAPDAFGTLFGATAAVVRFRQALGYVLVRLGASRGSRTGDPAAVMVRPVSARATEVVEQLRARLAARLETQLSLLARDDAGPRPKALEEALWEGLVANSAPVPAVEVEQGVRGYTQGPRPLDAVVVELRQFVGWHGDLLARRSAEEQRLIRHRIVEGRPWWEAAQAMQTSIPGTMRATRRAFAAFVRDVDELAVDSGHERVPKLRR
ncbi:MAG: GNAT family N-acetyltransferase [Myxococcota bacterium]